MLGSSVGPYEIVAKLGEGGMGQVYLARDSRLHRKVALKTVNPEKAGASGAARRVLIEARAAAHLTHPNIAAIHDIVETASGSCIVMEYVPGLTLRSRLLAGPLPVTTALKLGIQVVGAMAYAHRAGVIHRDLKPANIMISASGQAKILDFGIAKMSAVDSSSGATATAADNADQVRRIAGTPAYIAPELFRGAEPSAITDVYSLGITLFEMLTASSPYISAPSALLDEGPNNTVPLAHTRNPEVPEQLSAIVARAMAVAPRCRYESAERLLTDLQEWDVTEETRSRPGSARPRRRLAAVLLAGVCLLAFGAALAVPRLAARRFALSAMPADARGWYEQGDTALREGAFFTAAKRFEQAIALHTEFPLAHARLAEARAELDDDSSKDALLEVQKLVPNISALPTYDALSLEAIRGMVTRDFAAAVRAFRSIAAARPRDAAALVDVGRAHEANEKLADAKASYEAAVSLDAHSPAAFLGLGSIEGKLKNIAPAMAAYAQAESLYKTGSNLEGVAEVAYRRGELLEQLEQPKKAGPELERSLRVAIETGNAHQRVRCLFRLASVRALEGNTDLAKQLAQEGVALGRDMPTVTARGLINLGNVEFQAARFGDARRHFEEALASAHRHTARRTEAWALLSLGSLEIYEGHVLVGQNRIEEALPFYRDRGYRREEAVAHQLLGQAQWVRAAFADALRSFQQQLSVARMLGDEALEASADAQLGATLVLAEHFAEALPHAEAAIRLYERHEALLGRAEAAVVRARALIALGRLPDAAAVLTDLRRSNLGALGGSELESQAAEIAADLAFRRGRLSVAARELASALSLTSVEADRAWLTIQRARVLAWGTGGGRGRGAADGAARWAESNPDSYLSAPILLAAADVAMRSGELEEALSRAQSVESAFERSGRKMSLLHATLLSARLAARLRRVDLAEKYRQRSDDLERDLAITFGAGTWKSMVMSAPWLGWLRASSVTRPTKRVAQ